MAKIGYVREPLILGWGLASYEEQVRGISLCKADEIIIERESKKNLNLENLNFLLNRLQTGDELIVFSLDRLGIKTGDLFKDLVPLLDKSQVKLNIITKPTTTNLSNLSQWFVKNDHIIKLEKKSISLRLANEARVQKQITENPQFKLLVEQYLKEGLSKQKIANNLGISKTTVYKLINQLWQAGVEKPTV